MALVIALALSVAAGFLYHVSLVLGIVTTALAVSVAYLNLPMLLMLKSLPLPRRPLPRLAMLFWLAMFSIFNLPRAAFVQLNNRVTGNLAVLPSEAHVLVSRCIQYSNCRHKVTVDINNCRECGRCKIGEIKRICLARGLSATVESGGTSARQCLKTRHPKLVIAVACERELLAGILDTSLPVVGVMIKPGPVPCTDSDVKISELEIKLNAALKEG